MAKGKKRSSEYYENAVKEICDELGFGFIGFCRDENSPKILAISHACIRDFENNEVFSIETRMFLKNKRNPHDALRKGGVTRRKPDEYIIGRFRESGAFHPNTEFKRIELVTGKYSNFAWEVSCFICKEINISSHKYLQRGDLPCSCRDGQKYAYIISIDDFYLKFGVSVSPGDIRHRAQKSKTNLPTKFIGSWEFPHKSACYAAEKLCKKELETGVLSKRDYADGYTETSYLSNIDKVIKIYENYGGVKL